MFSLCSTIYNIDDILTNDFKIEKKRENKEWVEYLDLVCSFDIETSSFYIGENKAACMYIWQLGINGKVTIGRTWDEFVSTINKIVKFYNLNEYRRLIIYVHNLSFEFQWICHKFTWASIFARAERKPMKALTTQGIEFRCSYILSGCSLEKVGEDLQKYKVEKLVGNLDYNKLRLPITKLSKKELQYCINDVLVVMAYIQEQKEYYKKLIKIPLTNTGRVRKLMQGNCYDKKYREKYRRLMSQLTIEKDEYSMMRRAFQGGFTHANYLYSEDTLNSEKVGVIKSYDLCSSYPTVMISELYPCSKGEFFQNGDINEIENDKLHLYIFNIRFKNIRPRLNHENYISKSKCWQSKGIKENNGRVVSADVLTTTITNVDFDIIKKFYEWDGVAEVGRGYKYKKGYLPFPVVNTILDLYEDKTKLKDVEGQELEYVLKKGMLNSTYGMACMSIDADIINFFNEWSTEEGDINEALDHYNNDLKRFLYYGWAVFITSYARRNLFFAIKELGDDYIYSDTDSVKFMNYEKHADFFNKYNEWMTNRLNKACEAHKIDPERVRPKTKTGESKQLGIFENDGTYLTFKTLGAKRYLVNDKKKGIVATVAGLGKKSFSAYLKEQDNPFDFFKDGMTVPAEYSGKLCHTYIDTPIQGIVTDYEGNVGEFYEDSSIWMGASIYKLGISESYRALLNSKIEQVI